MVFTLQNYRNQFMNNWNVEDEKWGSNGACLVNYPVYTILSPAFRQCDPYKEIWHVIYYYNSSISSTNPKCIMIMRRGLRVLDGNDQNNTIYTTFRQGKERKGPKIAIIAETIISVVFRTKTVIVMLYITGRFRARRNVGATMIAGRCSASRSKDEKSFTATGRFSSWRHTSGIRPL